MSAPSSGTALVMMRNDVASMAQSGVLALNSESMMLSALNDDALEIVLVHLDPANAESLSTVCRRWRLITHRESIWEAFARRRWWRRRLSTSWIYEASRAGQSWRAHYVQREASIRRKNVPVFTMTTRLEVGRMLGLHLFEPRYKWLIRRAVEDHDSHFVFCTQQPQKGERGWVCEARRVEFMADGRANFDALPLARCILEQVWCESVPGAPDAPKLGVANIEELQVSTEPSRLTNRGHDDQAANSALSREHRSLLELLINHPQAVRALRLTEDRVLELLLLDERLGAVISDDDEDDQEGDDEVENDEDVHDDSDDDQSEPANASGHQSDLLASTAAQQEEAVLARPSS